MPQPQPHRSPLSRSELGLSGRPVPGLLRVLLVALVGCLSLVASCASDPARFRTAVAPEFGSLPHASISVLGVYRNGRLDPDSWDEIGPIMLAPLHLTECEALFAGRLRKDDSTVAMALDEAARADGVPEGLVDATTPAAQGDVVLLFHVSGKLPAKQTKSTTGADVAPPSGRGGRGGRVGRGPSSSSLLPADALEIAATVFSRTAHRSIAMVSLTYSGASVDEALQRFAQKLAALLPGAACGGWNWAVHLDPDRIRKLSEP